MNDNSSYVLPSVDQDDSTVDVYDTIKDALKLKKDIHSFMEVITTALIFEPSLITMENILFVIDDKRCRHPNLSKESGRQMLRKELDILEAFQEYPNAVVDYFYEKFSWDETYAIHTPEELVQVFHNIIYAYNLCFTLRDYVSEANKMFSQFQTERSKLQRDVTLDDRDTPDY